MLRFGERNGSITISMPSSGITKNFSGTPVSFSNSILSVWVIITVIYEKMMKDWAGKAPY
jgi:hypothetical protein